MRQSNTNWLSVTTATKYVVERQQWLFTFTRLRKLTSTITLAHRRSICRLFAVSVDFSYKLQSIERRGKKKDGNVLLNKWKHSGKKGRNARAFVLTSFHFPAIFSLEGNAQLRDSVRFSDPSFSVYKVRLIFTISSAYTHFKLFSLVNLDKHIKRKSQCRIKPLSLAYR